MRQQPTENSARNGGSATQITRDDDHSIYHFPVPRLPSSALVIRALAGVAAAATLVASSPAAIAAPSAPQPADPPPVRQVVLISIDGLNPQKITRQRTPAMVRMIRHGASTRNARTAYEKTLTLPNHTSMVTSRRVYRSSGGHGVTWNDDRLNPMTVQRAAGHGVGSAFSVLEGHDRSAAVFASKEKFRLFDRSWPFGVDRFTLRRNNHDLMSLAMRDVVNRKRPFTFIHLSAPDVAGHAHGWRSKQYRTAVRRADAEVGRLLRALGKRPTLRQDLTVILTADHGGGGRNHGDRTLRANYRVPFVVWGASVPRRANLYALNPDFTNPGRTRPGYNATRQPVRNGMAANLALDLLGLPAVTGSELNADQTLDVR